jgi:regulator of protease activity HflC (stomatin/prohibitin superfamily)
MTAVSIALIVLAVFLLIIAFSAVRIVPQARAGIVERLGRYQRTLGPGLALIVPFVDRVKPLLDLREQVVSFPPQPVITEDNLVVGIDTVIYFTVTEPRSVTYEVASPLQAIEQLTVTTLRNVIGGMTLEETLTSRDSVNSKLRAVLDDATGRWGIRVNRVELKSVEPPRTVQEAMEKQMRAERDRRAAILHAEGVKQSQILTAEGEKQAAVLKAEGARTAAILRAEGESKAIETVFTAIHENGPDERLLTYQYLQMLPQLAQGSANKVWVIPSDFSSAFAKLGDALGGEATTGRNTPGREGAPLSRARLAARDDDGDDPIREQAAADAEAATRAAAEAAREAAAASTPMGSTVAREPGPPMAPVELPPGSAPPNGTAERE